MQRKDMATGPAGVTYGMESRSLACLCSRIGSVTKPSPLERAIASVIPRLARYGRAPSRLSAYRSVAMTSEFLCSSDSFSELQSFLLHEDLHSIARRAGVRGHAVKHLILPDHGLDPTALVAVSMEGTLDVVPATVRREFLEPEVLKHRAQREPGKLTTGRGSRHPCTCCSWGPAGSPGCQSGACWW